MNVLNCSFTLSFLDWSSFLGNSFSGTCSLGYSIKIKRSRFETVEKNRKILEYLQITKQEQLKNHEYDYINSLITTHNSIVLIDLFTKLSPAEVDILENDHVF
jgi:hypothetical protein